MEGKKELSFYKLAMTSDGKENMHHSHIPASHSKRTTGSTMALPTKGIRTVAWIVTTVASQSSPKFRNQIASPYLGGPVSYESVR